MCLSFLALTEHIRHIARAQGSQTTTQGMTFLCFGPFSGFSPAVISEAHFKLWRHQQYAQEAFSKRTQTDTVSFLFLASVVKNRHLTTQ